MPENIRGAHQVEEVDQVITRVIDVLIRQPDLYGDAILTQPLRRLMQLDRISAPVLIQRGPGYKEYFHEMGFEIQGTDWA